MARPRYANVVATLALVVAGLAAFGPGDDEKRARAGERTTDDEAARVNPALGLAARPLSFTGKTSTITDGLSVYSQPARATSALIKKPLDRLPVRCHGGTAWITWYVGNLEPTSAGTGLHLSIFLDGRRIGTLIKGGADGIYDDGPASLPAVVPCPEGTHSLHAEIDSLDGEWGIPYANAGEAVPRGFTVLELWNE